MTTTYLADKSALTRISHPLVEPVLRPLLEEGLVATCAAVDLEVLYGATSLAEYEAIKDERAGFDDIPLTPEVMDRALEAQHMLAEHGKHRVAVMDLVIAAAAESTDHTVLHYDADFERIGEATGIAHRWVAPQGSL